MFSVIFHISTSWHYVPVLPPPVGKGAVSVGFVSPSVAYIANNSRTRNSKWPWRTPYPDFNIRPFFDAKYL